MHRARCSPGHTENGFTLLEAVIALGIVALIVTGYLSLRTSALADGIEARNWRLAREIAEEKMSELLAGAHETRPQSGVPVPLEEKFRGFSYQILIGETAINELESSIASANAEQEEGAGDRAQWQRNRDLFLKASARGQSYFEYQDKIAQEEEQREAKAPAETEFEEVAVVVFFPKLDAKYEGQKESFVIKAKVSTLALSGLTPDQAKQVAESKGQAAAGTANTGGGKQ